MSYILGKKLGMTRIFDKDGKSIPVTLIKSKSCLVTFLKTKEKEKYSAIQLGYGNDKKLAKPQVGHLKNASSKSRHLKEFRINKDKQTSEYKVGQKISVDAFKEGDIVRVSAISKGKGYAGVVKRHHFAGGPKSHGSDQHRAPGSIGAQQPQHVTKGRRMAGHMGVERITVKNVLVVNVDKDKAIIVLKGPIPGANKSLIEIRKING